LLVRLDLVQGWRADVTKLLLLRPSRRGTGRRKPVQQLHGRSVARALKTLSGIRPVVRRVTKVVHNAD
jgi:hypothetical protein